AHRHDGPQHQRRPHSPRADRRAWTRSRRTPQPARRRRPPPFRRRRLHLRPGSASPHPCRSRRHHHRRIFLCARPARATRRRFTHPARHGATRNRTRRRRAAHRQRLHALGVYFARPPHRAGGFLRFRHHHRLLHHSYGRRRRKRSSGRCRARPPRRPRHARSPPRCPEPLSSHLHPRQHQPHHACCHHRRSSCKNQPDP